MFELGREKGYTLVACSLGGINAYFVRDDLLDAEQFAGPFETAQFYHPARFFVVNQSSGHPRAWEQRPATSLPRIDGAGSRSGLPQLDEERRRVALFPVQPQVRQVVVGL